jgi:hypothetical protein
VNTTIGTSIAAGKPKKVALTACMRERLTIINAMIWTNTTCGSSINQRALDFQDSCYRPALDSAKAQKFESLVAYLADHGAQPGKTQSAK